MKRLILAILIICMALSNAALCFADSVQAPNIVYEVNPREIRTAEDLFAMADDPSGTYQLMNDIDLDDYEWKPFAFSGKFIGDNHRLMNIHISEYTDETRTVYDCNHKPYETHFVGFFGILEDAYIENLELLSIEYSVDCSDECVFSGGLAGYMYGSKVTGCKISGRSYLSTGGKCFGIGGIAGYGGESTIYGCIADTTLTCIDQDLTYKDEQFMGGAYALGYIDLDSCTIYIDGYDSDHGYVHDGGLIGSYYKYNGDYGHGTVSNNTVKGKITFYEDNTNRRAYCSAYIGEVMNWSLSMDYNSESFTRDEIFDYSASLGPHWDCKNPKMIESKAFDEEGYGIINCTKHSCTTCGYTYYDDYTTVRITAEDIHITLEKESSNKKHKIYVGETALIHIDFKPYNASPLGFEIVSSDDSIVGIGSYELVYKDGTASFCDAEIRFEAPGSTKLSVNADGKEYTSMAFDVCSKADYIKDKYGVLIIAAIILVVIIVILIIALSGKKKKKGRHACK